jgi:hypothetical protein
MKGLVLDRWRHVADDGQIGPMRLNVLSVDVRKIGRAYQTPVSHERFDFSDVSAFGRVLHAHHPELPPQLLDHIRLLRVDLPNHLVDRFHTVLAEAFAGDHLLQFLMDRDEVIERSILDQLPVVHQRLNHPQPLPGGHSGFELAPRERDHVVGRILQIFVTRMLMKHCQLLEPDLRPFQIAFSPRSPFEKCHR